MSKAGLIGGQPENYSGIWGLRSHVWQARQDDWESSELNFVGNVTSSDVSSSSITLPSGLKKHDVVFIVGAQGTNSTYSTPSGWTFLCSEMRSYVSFVVYYKVMGDDPDTSVNDLTATVGKYYSFAIRNLIRDTSFFAADTQTDYNSNGDYDVSPISITNYNTLVIIIFLVAATGESDTKTGYTRFVRESYNSPLDNRDYTIQIYRKNIYEPSTESPGTFGSGDGTVGGCFTLRGFGN
jgi:hypothetical protein